MGSAARAEPTALLIQQELRGGFPGRHPWVQPADQCAVRPRWLRLYRRLRRGPGFGKVRPRHRFQEQRRRGPGADPGHRGDLEDLPATALTAVQPPITRQIRRDLAGAGVECINRPGVATAGPTAGWPVAPAPRMVPLV